MLVLTTSKEEKEKFKASRTMGKIAQEIAVMVIISVICDQEQHTRHRENLPK
jgi:hypothetical protein